MSVYDENDYYAANAVGSRLSRVFDPGLALFDRLQAGYMARLTPQRHGRVADMGGGVGRLLSIMRGRGFQVCGTTLSRTAALVARDRYGVDLRYTAGVPDDWPSGGFDAVSYWHVFEHLEDPAGHLAAVARLLDQGGRLFMEIPNPESLGAALSRRAWLGGDARHHVNMLNRREVTELLAASGFRVARVGQFSLKFSFLFVWSGLMGRLFPGRYDFDAVFDLFKQPRKILKQSPGLAMGGLLGLLSLSPLAVALVAVGLMVGRGEVLRLVAVKS